MVLPKGIKTQTKKASGEKSHFSKFTKNYISKNNFTNSLEINLQDVSDDKYFKLYKINSNLITPEIETLENSINFTQERENLFIGLNASVYETLKDSYNDKYEYIFPELTIDKNLFSNEKINSIDFQTNFKVHNYDTNRLTSFFVNDFNLETNDRLIGNIFNSKFLANIRNINYEAKKY